MSSHIYVLATVGPPDCVDSYLNQYLRVPTAHRVLQLRAAEAMHTRLRENPR
jgi:hypothetical protein